MDFDQVMQMLRGKTEIKFVQFISDKGPNSCKECLKHHGKIFRADDPNKPELPIHPNCRCKYVEFSLGVAMQYENNKKFQSFTNHNQFAAKNVRLTKNMTYGISSGMILSAATLSSDKKELKSVIVRVAGSPGIGGIRISGRNDMLEKLERDYAPGTISELIISNHGEISGEFELGSKGERLELMTPLQIQRLKKLLAPNAIIDIRMCYGVQDKQGERVAQELADKLQCRISAYANQVSPWGTRPLWPKNTHLSAWERIWAGAGKKIFFPKKKLE